MAKTTDGESSWPSLCMLHSLGKPVSATSVMLSFTAWPALLDTHVQCVINSDASLPAVLRLQCVWLCWSFALYPMGGHTGVCINFGTAMISRLLDSLQICWNPYISSILHAHLQNTAFCACHFVHILVK